MGQNSETTLNLTVTSNTTNTTNTSTSTATKSFLILDKEANKENNINSGNITAFSPMVINHSSKKFGNGVSSPLSISLPNSGNNSNASSPIATNIFPLHNSASTIQQAPPPLFVSSPTASSTSLSSPNFVPINPFLPHAINKSNSDDSLNFLGGGASGAGDNNKPVKKKLRNSQSMFYTTFNHLSIHSQNNSLYQDSPLSRSTSDLSHYSYDIHDSDQFTIKSRPRTLTMESPRLRRLDFGSSKYSSNLSASPPPPPPPSPFLFDNNSNEDSANSASIGSPSTLSLSHPHNTTLYSSPPTSPYKFDGEAPPTPLQNSYQSPHQQRLFSSLGMSNYPSSPEPSPLPPTPIRSGAVDDAEAATNCLFSSAPPTPLCGDLSEQLLAKQHQDDDDSNSPNTSVDITPGSPYKTPSKSITTNTKSPINSSQSHSFVYPLKFKPIVQSPLSHSSDSITVKKRSRTFIDSRGDSHLHCSNNEGFSLYRPNKQSPDISSRPLPTISSNTIGEDNESLLSSSSTTITTTTTTDNINNHLLDGTEYKLMLNTCTGRPGFNNIAPEVLHQLITDNAQNIVVIDCRYSYEYNGGHVKNAINIPPLVSSENLLKMFFDTSLTSDKIIIFHCEFSSKRAPDCYNIFRDMDRRFNNYPTIQYPQIYLLSGGYKRFWETFPTSCDGGYTTMNDSRYTNEFKNEKKREEDLKKEEQRRKNKRSQSFHNFSAYTRSFNN
ncbi:hypothetical protein CYY_003476 [Polysphondylium violaceum]|uniref:protein-tyrosine-phosphatase n=1 Tax=Polysphondylium violaceum TaxID=133409 RepID=A0A8J4PXM6_9MYCE|nr:hypothetical protein CYY_003476 [Polysphondylium violaceum]